jgi:DNA-binding protein YbaB
MPAINNLKDMSKFKKMADDTKKIMEEIRATGMSKKGYVRITLDGEKELKNIEFSENALKTNPEELSKCAKEAHKAAAREIDKMVKKQMKNSGLSNFLMGK